MRVCKAFRGQLEAVNEAKGDYIEYSQNIYKYQLCVKNWWNYIDFFYVKFDIRVFFRASCNLPERPCK